MKDFIFCLTFISFCSADILRDWSKFKVQYKKNYKSSEEESKRLEIFKENCDFIAQHNENISSFRVGVNDDADLTYDEISERLTMKPG